jgi:hypothetical protein
MATIAELLPTMVGSWADEVINAFDNAASNQQKLQDYQSTKLNQTYISISPEIVPLKFTQVVSHEPKCYVSQF